jgi:hypothetical protein
VPIVSPFSGQNRAEEQHAVALGCPELVVAAVSALCTIPRSIRAAIMLAAIDSTLP